VRRWVSAHIIPHSPIDLADQTHNTLLCGESVTFEPIDGDESAPEWTRVTIEDGSKIITMKEWCCLLLLLLTDSRHICLRFLLGVFSALTLTLWDLHPHASNLPLQDQMLTPYLSFSHRHQTESYTSSTGPLKSIDRHPLC